MRRMLSCDPLSLVSKSNASASECCCANSSGGVTTSRRQCSSALSASVLRCAVSSSISVPTSSRSLESGGVGELALGYPVNWTSWKFCHRQCAQWRWEPEKRSQKRPRCQARATVGMASAIVGPPEGYRPNVGLCLVNGKNEVFVASRLDIADSWQMPQGGVDDGEEPFNAAIRELREETGVTSAQLIGEVKEWLTYDFPPDVKVNITQLWGREWTGQAQKWFLFLFTGDDSEVNLAGDGTEPPEFGNWKWLPAEDVLKVAVDFKKPVYAQAFKSLANYVESWAKL